MNPWNPLYTGAVWLLVALIAWHGIRGEQRMIRKAQELRRAGGDLSDDQRILTSEDEGSGATHTNTNTKTVTEFSKHDLVLGKRASRHIDRIATVSLAAAIGIAVGTYTLVPLDTLIVARISRHSEPGPMYAWIAFIPALLWLTMLRRSGRKPDAGHMRSGSRKGVFIVGVPMLIWSVYFQLAVAIEVVSEGFRA